MADSGSAMAAIDRRAHVAQEEEHDEDGEHGALDQRLHRGCVVAARVGDGVVDLASGATSGYWLAELAQLGVDDVGDRKLARPLGAEYGERDHGLAVESREGARLAGVVDDLAEIGQAHLAAAGQQRSWSRPAPRRVGRRRACGSPAPGRRPRRGRRRDRRWSRAPGVLTSPAVMPRPAAGRDRAGCGSRGRRRR